MKKLVTLALAIMMAVPVLTGIAASPAWPMPFCDSSHTNCAPNINISTPMERQWVFFTESKNLGFPVSTDEHVYVSDSYGIIYCLSKDLGEEIWRYDLGFDASTGLVITGSNLAFVTMNTNIGALTGGMGGGGSRRGRGGRGGHGGGGGGGGTPGGPGSESKPQSMAGLLDLATGKPVLTKELVMPDFILGTATVVEDKAYMIYIQLDEKYNSGASKIVCTSVKDFSTLWSSEFPTMIAMPPTFGDGNLLIQAVKIVYNEEKQQPEMSGADLALLKAGDGSVIWKKQLPKNEIMMVPSFGNGTFYACKIIIPEDLGEGGGGRGPMAMPESYLLAINPKDGSEKWATKSPGDEIMVSVPAITPQGIIVQAMVTKTMCFDPETGDVKWQTPTAGGFSFTGMQFACTGGQVISTRGSKLSIINSKSGEEVFVEDLKFQAGIPGMGQKVTIAYPCIANDMVYIAADKLIAYGKKVIGIKSDPAVVRFEQIEVGQTKTKPFRVIYNGDGEISGKLEVNQPWMKLNNTAFTTATQNYELKIDATKLEPGEYKGEISIKTSVGEAKIPVNIRIVPKPPLKLEINLDEEVLTNVNPFKITGTTVPGAKLTISGRPSNVGTDGKFAEEIPLKEGLNRLTFEAVDAKGAKAIAIRVIFLDTKKPLLQVSLAENQVFMELPVKFSGRTEPGVRLRVNGEPVEVLETGEYEAVIPGFEDGEHKVKVVATDKAGNTSAIEKAIIVDTKPLEFKLDVPGEPIFTNQPSYIIKGSTRPGTVVRAMIGAEPVAGARAKENGEFEFTIEFKEEGEFQVVVMATYDQKNAQKSFIINFDKTPPAIKCDLPATTDRQSLTIYAITDPMLEVTITVGADKKVVKADANGKFQASFTLKPGLNPVTMTTKDMAGNEGKFNGFVKFEQKKEVQKVIIKLTVDKTDWSVNGEAQKPLKVAPTTTKLPTDLKGSTYMPIKEVAAVLFADTAWDGAEKKVTLIQKLPDGTTNIIELWIGRKTARINGKEVPISSNGKLYPTLYEGKTLLPLRFVADALGCTTNFESTTKTITLTYPK